jgi:hypothetical protein
MTPFLLLWILSQIQHPAYGSSPAGWFSPLNTLCSRGDYPTSGMSHYDFITLGDLSSEFQQISWMWIASWHSRNKSLGITCNVSDTVGFDIEYWLLQNPSLWHFKTPTPQLYRALPPMLNGALLCLLTTASSHNALVTTQYNFPSVHFTPCIVLTPCVVFSKFNSTLRVQRRLKRFSQIHPTGHSIIFTIVWYICGILWRVMRIQPWSMIASEASNYQLKARKCL